MRDLRVFADSLQGEVRHFRTKEGLECDAVIHLRNGNYGLIEIKLGGDRLIEEGADTLKAVRDKIDTTKMNSSLKCVCGHKKKAPPKRRLIDHIHLDKLKLSK